MGSISDVFPLLFFYFIPLVTLVLSKWINKQFKLLNLSLKVVDLLIPYMILLTFMISQLYLTVNLVPYLVIVVSVLGILIVSYDTFYKKELNVYLFFRIWWRVVFITCFVTYIGAGAWIVYQVV